LVIGGVMPLAWIVASLPSLATGLMAIALLRLGTRLWVVPAFIGNLWQAGLVLLWSLEVLSFFFDRASHVTLIPALLWGYGVTLGPLAYMGRGEAVGDRESSITGSEIALILAPVSYIFLAILHVIEGGALFALPMLVLMGLSAALVQVIATAPSMAAKAKASLDERDDQLDTALHRAAARDDLKALRRLLHRGADMNPRNIHGWTPLHVAAHANSVKCATALLDSGAEIEPQTYMDSATPLHVAAANGHTDAVAILLDRGAAVNATVSSGATPLDIARRYGYPDTARALRTAGGELRWTASQQE
jgi:hypothetical protein